MEELWEPRSGRFPPRFQIKAWEAWDSSPEKEIHEAVRTELKVQWRPQEAGKAKDTEYFEKAPVSEKRHPKREPMRPATSCVVGVCLSHLEFPSWPVVWIQSHRFNVCKLQFWLCFIPLTSVLLPPLEIGMFLLYHCGAVVFSFVFIFTPKSFPKRRL